MFQGFVTVPDLRNTALKKKILKMTAQRYLLNRENIEVVSKIKENKEHCDEVAAKLIPSLWKASEKKVFYISGMY